jgi:D-alanyl-lipoteichoic acid acyltransferase DltB (MBOAT superfamily)
LLGASLVFLWICSGGQSLLPLALFLLVGYAGLKLIESGRARTVTPLVVATILLYVWLKKYTFLPAPLFLRISYSTLGLSYIFFRIVHLLVDASNDALPGKVGVTAYLTYTLNFTTLVAGPIQRFQDFEKARRLARRPHIVDGGAAIERIVVGFFKTNVMALLFSMVHSEAVSQVSTSSIWWTRVLQGAIAIASYPFFLYCNFSGYIDIVIGIAGLLGMKLPENFDRPFSASNFIDFWNRWHITLSTWLKTYVYIPLVMRLMIRYPAESLAPIWGVLAFFVTFFLVGAWHGQTWAFLFFGVLQGLGVSVNKLFEISMVSLLGRKRTKSVTANPIYVAVCRGLTFTWFAFTLLWFWSTWSNLATLATAMGKEAIVVALGLILITATIALALWEVLRAALLDIRWRDHVILESRYARTAWCTLLVLLTIATVVLTQQQAPEIVYKAF